MAHLLTRLARNPIGLQGVHAKIDAIEGRVVFEKNGKNQVLKYDASLLSVSVENETMTWNAIAETKEHARCLGTAISLSKSAIEGLTKGFKVDLEIKGTGFKVASQNGADGKVVLVFQLGYSNETTYTLPSSVSVKIATPTQFSLESIDKQALGQVSAEIRSLRKVNPYKGKGILVKGSVLILKETKKKK